MPAKKKSEEEDLDIDEEMEQEVAPEPKKLKKKPAPLKIAVTNWEDEVEPADEEPTSDEPEIVEEKSEPAASVGSAEEELPAFDEIEEVEYEPEAVEPEVAAPKSEPKKIAVVMDDDEEEPEAQTEEDGHEWHKIDEEEVEDGETEQAWSETEETPVDSSIVEEETPEEPAEVDDTEPAVEESPTETEPESEPETETEPEAEEDESEVDTPTNEEPELDVTKPVGELLGEHESDESLIVSAIKAEDEEAAANAKKPSKFKRLKSKLKQWWQTPKIRRALLAFVALIVIILAFLPVTRYAFLNVVGVRATASLSVVDSETKLPLRNVDVEIAGIKGTTNETGQVTLNSVKLGSQTLTITKSAYDEYSQAITIKTGTNTIQSVELLVIGTSFNLKLVDWLSGEPLEGGEVSFGENSAFSNAEGAVKLVIPPVNDDSITASATSEGYLASDVKINTTESSEITVKLVLARKNYFISKRSGTYDVYGINADGSNEELLLSGTGNERAGLSFDVSPSGATAMLAATRDKNVKNEDGFILTGLYAINTTSKELKKLDSSESIDMLGWIDETLIYLKINAGASGENPERHRLMSYNTTSGEMKQIAASNYFNDVLVAGKYVFYAPSDLYKKTPKAYLFRSSADGTDIQTVLNKNVWTILRTDLDEIIFDSQQKWYQGKINTISNIELDTKPTDYASRLYTTSPDGSKSAWVDMRDGKGVLIIAETATGKEVILTSQAGLRNPITWLSNNHLVYRVVTTSETADYVLSLSDGKKQSKIVDVTDVSGADRWYYYY